MPSEGARRNSTPRSGPRRRKRRHGMHKATALRAVGCQVASRLKPRGSVLRVGAACGVIKLPHHHRPSQARTRPCRCSICRGQVHEPRRRTLPRSRTCNSRFWHGRLDQYRRWRRRMVAAVRTRRDRLGGRGRGISCAMRLSGAWCLALAGWSGRSLSRGGRRVIDGYAPSPVPLHYSVS